MSTVDSNLRIVVFHIGMSLLESTLLLNFCKPKSKLNLLAKTCRSKVHLKEKKRRNRLKILKLIRIKVHFFHLLFSDMFHVVKCVGNIRRNTRSFTFP